MTLIVAVAVVGASCWLHTAVGNFVVAAVAGSNIGFDLVACPCLPYYPCCCIAELAQGLSYTCQIVVAAALDFFVVVVVVVVVVVAKTVEAAGADLPRTNSVLSAWEQKIGPEGYHQPVAGQALRRLLLER